MYSKANLVKLFLNDKLVGSSKPKDAKCIFKCRYEAGTLTAIAYDKDRKEVARKTLSSGTGKPHFKIRTEQDHILI